MRAESVLEVILVFLSGAGGAALMTIFLKLVNAYTRSGVRVPLILGQVVHHYFVGSGLYKLKHKNTYGHLLHILVGVFFAFCYSWFWKRGLGGPTASSIFIFGLINGIVGAAGWFLFLKSTYKPKQVKERVFFPVIVLAHFIFAFGVTGIYFGFWHLSSRWI